MSDNAGGNERTELRRTPKLSLKPADKLKTKQDFDVVKENGQKFVTPLFILLYAGSPASSRLRCGIICSRKFDKRAVIRNRARRILWEAFRLLKQRVLPCEIVLIPRRGILHATMNDAMQMLESVFRKTQPQAISRNSDGR